MNDAPSVAATAQAIADARDGMVAFAQTRSAQEWDAPVLAAAGDARPVGVIVDHVGHAYEYLAQFIRAVVAGETPAVDSQVVDDLNAEHAAGAAGVDAPAAIARLRRGGDALIEMVGALTEEQLEIMGGRVRRLATIGALHADNHRTELEEALRATAYPTG